MNPRTKYLVSFFGLCIASVILLMVIALQLPKHPQLRWALLIVWLAAFVAMFLLIRYFRGRLPPPTNNQNLKGARAARRMAWIYLGGLVVGLFARGQELLGLPYGLGFLLPLIPIALATYYFRLSARLTRSADKSEQRS